MKFGKQLKHTVSNSLPEWQPNFIDYKDLKRKINVTRQDAIMEPSSPIQPSSETMQEEAVEVVMSATELSAKPRRSHGAGEEEDDEFLKALRHEVEKVNSFYLDIEEDYIIRFQFLVGKVDTLKMSPVIDRQQVRDLRRKLIEFQSEVVLLENFSAVNYTGLRKILKKHDKKTGCNLRNSYLLEVLETPFFLSNTLKKLMTAAERQLHILEMFTKFRRTASSPFDKLKNEPTPLQQMQPILKRLENGDDRFVSRLLNLLDDTPADKWLINWSATKEFRSIAFIILDSTDDHFVGVAVVTPQEKAQFCVREGHISTRLLRGQGVIHQVTKNGTNVTKNTVTGPWPSFVFVVGDSFEWRNESNENMVALIVTMPGFDGEMEKLILPADNRGSVEVCSGKRVVAIFPGI